MRNTIPALRRAALLCVVLLAAAPALAQDAWPARPVTLIAGYPAGGSVDLVARSLAPELASRLGVPVVIENLGGAGGTIAAHKVAAAAPDGYTLLVAASNEIVINKLITKNLRYGLQDFSALGLIASQPLLLVAAPGAGVKNLAEFTHKVRQNPGRFSYGSSGVGTVLHLAGEMVKQQGGLFITHIPYRGVAPLVSDLMGNTIDYGVFSLSSGLPHVRSGKLIALGTTEARRSAITPDIPALAETPQYKDVDIAGWFALMAPAHLPRPVFDKLKAALAASLQAPEFRKKMAAAGATVAASGLDIDRFLADEVVKYGKIVAYSRIEE